jgi:hypothetical protein
MNNLLDDSLVGLALLISLGYLVASLGPRTLRNRLLAALSGVLARAPPFLGLARAAQKLAAAAGKAQGACGGCDNCGNEPSSAKASPSGKASPSAEIKVSVDKIGRRA